MRLESSAPNKAYFNLQDVMFVCDCGSKASQLVADRDEAGT